MNIPEQCVDCVWQNVCMDERCMKEKPCASHAKAEPYDDDLINEILERYGR